MGTKLTRQGSNNKLNVDITYDISYMDSYFQLLFFNNIIRDVQIFPDGLQYARKKKHVYY